MIDSEEILKLKQRIKDLEKELKRAEKLISTKDKLELMVTRDIYSLFRFPNPPETVEDLEGRSLTGILSIVMKDPEFKKFIVSVFKDYRQSRGNIIEGNIQEPEEQN